MHIFTNISRTKGNQIMKFGQLIEYNMRKKIFLKIIHKMRWRCYSQTPFLKYQNWAYLWINSLKFYTACFYCVPSWGLSKKIETKLRKKILKLLPHTKLILKKRGLELVSLHYSWRKVFLFLYSIPDQISFSGCLYFVRYWAILWHYKFWN